MSGLPTGASILRERKVAAASPGMTFLGALEGTTEVSLSGMLGRRHPWKPLI